MPQSKTRKVMMRLKKSNLNKRKFVCFLDTKKYLTCIIGIFIVSMTLATKFKMLDLEPRWVAKSLDPSILARVVPDNNDMDRHKG